MRLRVADDVEYVLCYAEYGKVRDGNFRMHVPSARYYYELLLKRKGLKTLRP